ncbi:hypothetical protein WA026_011981 [Henosepilachna vigintioctopunctata]|uniref:P-type domain-containing protein n=1 Tax=Henosepilachna vigintioctopunctata TaxID=420089 RepID=A0AAW1VBX4_9CUCU
MPTFIEENQGTLRENELEDNNNSRFSKLCVLQFIASVLMTIFVIITPFYVYLNVFDHIEKDTQTNKCLVDNIYRLPCGKNNINETECVNVFCCFELSTNSCYHSIPSVYYYHSSDSMPNVNLTPLGFESVNFLNINVIDDFPKLKIILNDKRLLGMAPNLDSQFNVTNNDNDKISVTVFRKNTNEMLLTTAKGPLIACKEYLEWSLQLTTNRGVLFGLGQLEIDLNENSTLTKVIYKNRNDHNTLPYFMAYNNGKYHAVVIEHEGALKITVLPSYLIHIRSISGLKVEITLVEGPTPKDIYKHLRNEKVTIPEWALGVHLCRENEVKSLDAMLDEYDTFVKTRSAFPEFTYETDCIHDDLLLHLLSGNSTTEDVAKIFNKINMTEKFLLSFPPQIPVRSDLFERYKNLHPEIFYKDKTGNIYTGKYKNFDVAYPNYKANGIQDLLGDILNIFEGITELKGYTFTKSWPQEDTFHLTGDINKPFIDKEIQEALSYTLPWDLIDGTDIHLRYHNKYGPNMQKTVNSYQAKDFSFSSVSDAETFEPLIIQNTSTLWENMKNSLVTSLYNSIFGHSLISVPVCGSNNYDRIKDENLCLRWYIMAATMPLVRISSALPLRDPINLYSNYSKNKTIEVLKRRQSLIPFYRNILAQGEPLISPMFYKFPDDKSVHNLDEQYMLAEALLVVQPMTANIEILKIYLPPGIVWYELWGGLKYLTEKSEPWISFPIFKTEWVSFVIEGTIIPMVTYSSDAYSNIDLIVAMNCTNTCTAKGSILIEPDDTQVTFSADEEKITISTKDNKKHDKIKKLITKICFYKYDGIRCENGDVQKYIN